MKTITSFLLFVMVSVASYGQTIVSGSSVLFPMNGSDGRASVDISIDYFLTEHISIGADADLSFGSIPMHNILYVTSVEVADLLLMDGWSLQLRGGFGWGHRYTNDVTDHNFHTYRAGVRVCKYWGNRGIYLYPSANWMTYAEHIGMSRDRGWWQIGFGFVFAL